MNRLVVATLAILAPAVGLAGHGKAHPPVRFKIRVENVSTPGTLRLSTGGAAPAPNSPVVWATHTRPGVLFVSGHNDHGVGMEALAEDGNPEPIATHLASGGERGVVSSGFAAVPVGDSAPGPLLPGRHYELEVAASPGDRLSLATMFAQSNDVWIGTGEDGIALFDAKGKPITGDVTARLHYWDQGTETNEEPGLGANQGPRQKAPNTGTEERRRVGHPADGFDYPPVTQVVSVTIAIAHRVAAR